MGRRAGGHHIDYPQASCRPQRIDAQPIAGKPSGLRRPLHRDLQPLRQQSQCWDQASTDGGSQQFVDFEHLIGGLQAVGADPDVCGFDLRLIGAKCWKFQARVHGGADQNQSLECLITQFFQVAETSDHGIHDHPELGDLRGGF